MYLLYFDIISKFIKGKKVTSPKGFGKNYFIFASILAHSVQNIIQSLIVKVDYLLEGNSAKETDELNKNDPPLTLLNVLCVAKQKTCHCNCIHKLKTFLSLKRHHFIPRCPYYTTYFAFRRTGVHPPYFIS